VHKLLDYADGGNVADPWYTDDFEQAYRDVYRGCEGLLQSLLR
jgi:protein-tyrosine phosphatase